MPEPKPEPSSTTAEFVLIEVPPVKETEKREIQITVAYHTERGWIEASLLNNAEQSAVRTIRAEPGLGAYLEKSSTFQEVHLPSGVSGHLVISGADILAEPSDTEKTYPTTIVLTFHNDTGQTGETTLFIMRTFTIESKDDESTFNLKPTKIEMKEQLKYFTFRNTINFNNSITFCIHIRSVEKPQPLSNDEIDVAKNRLIKHH